MSSVPHDVRLCPLSARMCCKTRFFLAIGFGGEILAVPLSSCPDEGVSVPKLDATPTTLSKRRLSVAARGREA
jgi:hypothetical protein